jgi:hypothetical protein
VVLRQERKQRGGPCRFVGCQKLSFRLRPLEEFVFERRTAFKDSDQVLETLLSGIGGFGGTNRIWDVADEGDALFAGFVGDGEDGIAGNEGLQLDEINATALQVVHGTAAIGGSGDGNRTGKARLGTIEHRTGNYHAWSEQGSGGNFFAPLLEHTQFAAHITHAGHAVGDEKWQRDLFAMRKPVSEDGVNVHVPKARDEELSSAVDAGCSFAGRGDLVDALDVVVFDDYGAMEL